MKQIKFSKKFTQPITLALGMFDCVHSAHIELINKVKNMSKKDGTLCAVFTFTNNPAVFNKTDKLVYTFSERLERFKEEGAEVIIYKKADKKFAKTEAVKFLSILNKTLNIKGIVCGEDFRFGFKAEGDINLLKLFCQENNIKLEIIKTIIMDKIKISTTRVKEFLTSGNIETANLILDKPYRICGKVISGAGIGKTFLYATANIKLHKDKMPIKTGVYFTKTLVGGKLYKSVTSFGGRPTLNKPFLVCETHILDFKENLYKQEITVMFIKRLRDIEKFDSLQELKEQIAKDIEIARNSQ